MAAVSIVNWNFCCWLLGIVQLRCVFLKAISSLSSSSQQQTHGYNQYVCRYAVCMCVRLSNSIPTETSERLNETTHKCTNGFDTWNTHQKLRGIEREWERKRGRPKMNFENEKCCTNWIHRMSILNVVNQQNTTKQTFIDTKSKRKEHKYRRIVPSPNE